MATAAGFDPLADLAGIPPWKEWIAEASGGISPEQNLVAWLERLESQLPAHAAECRDDEVRLAMLWQHMVPKLANFLPDEVTHVVSAQLEASAKRGAAEALVDMVRLERMRLTETVGTRLGTNVDETTLRRLLDGIAADRASTGRALTAEVLETLCSITLDLEVTERRVGDTGGQISETLNDLREHVTAAADTLRALPSNISVQPQANEQVAIAVGRCLGRYAGTLETQLSWHGPEPANPESATALVWVLQELLHHLHGTTAGFASVTVIVESGMRVSISTPSAAFAVSRGEPDWMMRSRLRLQLAGGDVTAVPVPDGTCVELRLP